MRNSDKQILTELKEELGAVAATLAVVVKLAEKGEAKSFTLKEFRARHHLSESQFHKLKPAGRAPREMLIGMGVTAGVRISRDAEAEWIHSREAEAAEAGRRPSPNPGVANGLQKQSGRDAANVGPDQAVC